MLTTSRASLVACASSVSRRVAAAGSSLRRKHVAAYDTLFDIPQRADDGSFVDFPRHTVEIIAHRGSSGTLPGHTLPSYDEAIRAGTDWIELDVHPTKCGKMIVTHDIEFSHATNVADFPEFADRLVTKHAPAMDGEPEEMTGYFTTDFTLDEVKRLQVHLADGRTMDHLTTHSSLGVEFDKSSSFSVPTVTETAAFLKMKQQEVKDSGVSIRTPGGKKIRKAAHIPFRDDLNEEIEAAHRRWVAGEGDVVWPFHLRGRRYCIHFEYLKQINLTTDYERNVWQHEGKWYWVADENPDVGLYIETKRPGYYRSLGYPVEEMLVDAIAAADYTQGVIIQSFEADSLRRMADLRPDWPRVKLCLKDEVPNDPAELRSWLQEVSTYAQGIGCDKASIVPMPSKPPAVSAVVEAAHELGLFVHCYTFRTDPHMLHRAYGGNASVEFVRFFQLGVDGFFADFPEHACFASRLYEQYLRESEGRPTMHDFRSHLVGHALHRDHMRHA